MKMKKSLALYVLGGVFASALSRWGSILLGNEFPVYGLVIASVVLSPITSALDVLTSIALVVFALCVRKDKLPFLPPAVIGALHVLLALPLMLLPTASLAGIFEIWRFDAAGAARHAREYGNPAGAGTAGEAARDGCADRRRV